MRYAFTIAALAAAVTALPQVRSISHHINERQMCADKSYRCQRDMGKSRLKGTIIAMSHNANSAL